MPDAVSRWLLHMPQWQAAYPVIRPMRLECLQHFFKVLFNSKWPNDRISQLPVVIFKHSSQKSSFSRPSYLDTIHSHSVIFWPCPLWNLLRKLIKQLQSVCYTSRHLSQIVVHMLCMWMLAYVTVCVCGGGGGLGLATVGGGYRLIDRTLILTDKDFRQTPSLTNCCC